MNWLEILEIPPNELDSNTVEFVRSNLHLIDVNTLNSDELRKYFALSCFVIKCDSSSVAESKQGIVDIEKDEMPFDKGYMTRDKF